MCPSPRKNCSCDSGFGREGLKYAIEAMTEPKLLVVGETGDTNPLSCDEMSGERGEKGVCIFEQISAT